MTLRRRALVALLASTLLAAWLVRVPLLAVPGPESGLLVALLAALSSAWLAAGLAQARPLSVSVRWGLLDPSPGEQVIAEVRASLAIAAGMIGVPLALLVSEGLASGCRVSRGLPTFLLAALPAALLGTALGCLAGSLTRRPARVALLLTAAAGLSAGKAMLEAFVGPRHVVHELFLGPISTSAYMGFNSGLELPSSAWVHRAFAVVVAALALALATLVRCRRDTPPAAGGLGESELATDDSGWRSSRAGAPERAAFLLRYHGRRARRLAVLLAVLLVPFALAWDAAGLGPGRRTLERRLCASWSGTRTSVRFEEGTPAAAHAPRIALEADAAVQLAAAQVGLDPPWPIVVWAHADADSLFELTGARGYAFCAPWNHEVHVVVSRTGDVSPLRHEVAHAVAALIAAPWAFGASPRIGLVEGLATAIDEGYSRRPEAHVLVAAALAAGHLPAAGELVSLRGFPRTHPDLAYRASASFVGYLLLSRGPEAFGRLHAGASFEDAYGQSVEALDTDWRRFLTEDVRVPQSVLAAARLRFDPVRRPAFFRRACARLGQERPTGPAAHARLLAGSELALEAADAFCVAWTETRDPAHLEAAAEQFLRADRLASALDLVRRAQAAMPASDRVDALLARRFALEAALGQETAARATLELRRATGLAPQPEELDLAAEALASEDHGVRHFEAVLTAPRSLTALLEAEPDSAPALHALLVAEGQLPTGTTPAPDLAAAARHFASVAGDRYPALAGQQLLALGRAEVSVARWDEAESAFQALLDLPQADPLAALAAADGLELCRLARSGSRRPATQPSPAACRK